MTPRDIATAALLRSSKNRAVSSAGEPELLGLVQRSLRAFVVAAARVNPTYFAASAVVPGVDSVWLRPATAESVFFIETAIGAEVDVVPLEERTVDGVRGRLYRLGGSYHSVGGALDPAATDELTFFYSRRLADAATFDTPLDTAWPSAYDPLLIEEVAVYLALKDGRGDEAAELRVSRDSWLRLYLAFLDHETAHESRRFHPRRLVQNDTIPLSGLFAGGSEVKV